MSNQATLTIGDKDFPLNVLVGTENEHALDISTLRKNSKYITFDDGYGNTGSCESEITFIDGDKGILRYRGFDIAELAEKSNFLESCLLLFNGELPSAAQLEQFTNKVLSKSSLPTSVEQVIDTMSGSTHPMGVLSSALQALGGCYPDLSTNTRPADIDSFDEAASVIVAAIPVIAAKTLRASNGESLPEAQSNFSYSENFLHMMFGNAGGEAIDSAVSKALDLIFLLHADHEQNCSTSTCRMIASGGANAFASLSGAVSALWGPLHGGANMAVINMLNEIHSSGDDGSQFIQSAKEGKSRLMGFGHRVYRNYDPRAKILKSACDQALEALGVESPILDIARNLEKSALQDEYFIARKLYPNVDFYSGIILQAMGFPTNMFTVLFALGRAPGWLSHWKEIASKGKRIHRPRQIYQGSTLRSYVELDAR
ncbi:MAG: citrate synthase [Verrucomicrobiota bacterium]|nr:citrate synthase [Verrucomicrobiota bacterium]